MPVYKSTAEFLKVQLRNFKDATNRDKVLRSAVVSSLAPIKARIQQEGEKSDGSQIGEYSTKSLSFGKITNRFSDIANLKQLGRRIKKDKPSTFIGGYLEYRRDLGRQTEFVDLTLTGDMMDSLTVGPVGKTGFGIGFSNEEQFKIAKYNEKKYGPVFDQTVEEKADTLAEINRLGTQFLSR